MQFGPVKHTRGVGWCEDLSILPLLEDKAVLKIPFFVYPFVSCVYRFIQTRNKPFPHTLPYYGLLPLLHVHLPPTGRTSPSYRLVQLHLNTNHNRHRSDQFNMATCSSDSHPTSFLTPSLPPSVSPSLPRSSLPRSSFHFASFVSTSFERPASCSHALRCSALPHPFPA